MQYEFITELAKILNLSPLVVAYLVWLGWQLHKRGKELNTAFNKIRAVEASLKLKEPE